MSLALSRYMIVSVILSIAAVVCLPIAMAAPMQCSREDAIQAEKEASTLADWDAVYRAFKRYGHCDDASVGEGYSETVGRLLAKDWQHFGRLVQLAKNSRSFERFVIRHVDETVPSDDLRQIVENARMKCPLNAQRLCGLVKHAAE